MACIVLLLITSIAYPQNLIPNGEGHTDSVGKLVYNHTLSLNRSNSVKEYIAAKLPANKTSFANRGYAYLKPIASNKTPAGRQKNRRVEIYVYRKE